MQEWLRNLEELLMEEELEIDEGTAKIIIAENKAAPKLHAKGVI